MKLKIEIDRNINIQCPLVIHFSSVSLPLSALHLLVSKFVSSSSVVYREVLGESRSTVGSDIPRNQSPTYTSGVDRPGRMTVGVTFIGSAP